MMIRQILQTITKAEWKFVGLISAAVAAISIAPVIYGWLITPDGFVFTAMHFVSADDWFVYYMFIEQVRDGGFLLFDLFAPVDHLPVIRPLWLLVGWVARFTQVSAPAAMHLVRLALIPLFFATAYAFIAYIFQDKVKRKISLVFLAFSSGMGILLISRLAQVPLNYIDGAFRWPMDLWVPEFNTFLTLFTSPHFIAANILVLIIFFLALLFTERTNWAYAVCAGLAGLFVFSFHPFQVVKVFAILTIFFGLVCLNRRKFVWPLVGFGAIFTTLSAPAIVYYIWLLRFDWLTLQRSLQNLNPSTPVYITIIALGGLFVGMLIGIVWLFQQKKLWQTKYLFLVCWALVQLLLLYAPISYPRRLVLGIHFPMVMLTIIGGSALYKKYNGWIKQRLGAIIMLGVLIFLPSTLFAIAVDVMVFSQARELAYYDASTNQAFQWLRQSSPQASVIFSDFKTGLQLSAFAQRTSYVAHAVETPFYRQKKVEPPWFFERNRSQEIEHDFLTERKIDYIFFGEREQAHGNYQPEQKSYLKQIFNSPTVAIYQVL